MPVSASLEKIRLAAVKAGFEITSTEKYFIQDDLTDHFLYAGKNKPEIYFDPVIRSGISSFVALAVRSEVENGLHRLQSDLQTKMFDKVRSDFENNLGDYLFIVAEK